MTCTLYHGDARSILPTLPAESVDCVVTSPPYYSLRDYGEPGQLGLEPTPAEFVAALVAVFAEVRRVLRDDGTVWLNLGDSYAAGKTGNTNGGGASGLHKDGRPEAGRLKSNAIRSADMATMEFRKDVPPGLKPKDLIGIPWRVAFALQADGWYLRSDIIWSKPNPMPESVRDRPTKSHEYLFLLAKQERYYYDAAAIAEPHTVPIGERRQRSRSPGAANPGNRNGFVAGIGNDRAYPDTGRNRRSVWTISTRPYKGAHFAVMPKRLVEPCILAGCRPGGTVLDPFVGSGTVAVVAKRLGRDAIGIDLNEKYLAMARRRLAAIAEPLPFGADPAVETAVETGNQLEMF